MEKSPAHRPVDMRKQLAILAAARLEFFEQGYAGASIERIAAAAQVSKVTIYNRFRTKENLFSAMIAQECTLMEIEFPPLALTHQDLRHKLLAFARSMMVFLSRPDIIRFERRLAAEVEQYPDLGELFLNAGPRQLRTMLIQLITKAMASGQLAESDPRVAAEHLYGMIKGFSDMEWRFARADSALPNQPVIEEAVNRFLRAYAP